MFLINDFSKPCFFYILIALKDDNSIHWVPTWKLPQLPKFKHKKQNKIVVKIPKFSKILKIANGQSQYFFYEDELKEFQPRNQIEKGFYVYPSAYSYFISLILFPPKIVKPFIQANTFLPLSIFKKKPHDFILYNPIIFPALLLGKIKYELA
ncbi:MAG: hypothetical protein QXI58_00770 [Candidatus Micrarchaeia archaeon]